MPPDDLSRPGWRASLALGFERRGDRTVLATRRHDGPLVVQKSLHPEGEGVCHAIVVHPPGGIAGGDELAIAIEAGEGAHAVLTTPGAGKWYRSAGATARQHVRIAAGAASAVEWLPQESIVFDGALAELRWEARLAADARLIAWDIVCLGRTGSGESFATGRCDIDARVYRGGRLAWLERARIGEHAFRASPVGLAGRPVFGTMLVAAPEVAPEWIAACREEAPESGRAAVTGLPGVLLARYLGDSTESARRYFAELWKRLRWPVLGRAAIEPRIWRT